MCLSAMPGNLDLFRLERKINLLQRRFNQKVCYSAFSRDVDGGRVYPVSTESTCYLFQVTAAHSRAVTFHPRTCVHTHACEPVSSGSRRRPDFCSVGF